MLTKAGDVSEGEHAVLRLNPAQLGLWAFLGTLTMLFAGFTSAYLVRRAGSDWQPIALPAVLWLNTALLLASSAALEAGRAFLRRDRIRTARWWLLGGTGLGLVFLGGQLLAWRQLVAQGILLPTSPHSSFFYMLTAVHGAHLLAGILALLWALRRVWRFGGSVVASNALDLCATYWHFVDAIWVYLFMVLLVW